MINKIKMFLIKLFLVIGIIACITISSYLTGKQHAYQEFLDEKCHINKQTRDVECIVAL